MKNRMVAICAIIVALTLFITGINLVKATIVYDGLYDITYTTIAWQGFWMGEWDNWTSATYIGYVSISNGEISIPYSWDVANVGGTPYDSIDRQGVPNFWTTWRGTVDEGGNAKWTGSIFEMKGWNDDDYVFTFTGKINTDGTGSGTYTGDLPYCETVPFFGEKGGKISGTWTLQKQSSGSTNVIFGWIYQILGQLSNVGTIPMAIIGGAVVAGIIALGIRRKLRKRPSPPKPTPVPERESKPGKVELPPTGVPQGGIGLHVGPRLPEHPRLTRVLFDKFGDKVELDWTQPDFDADGMFGQYHLEGFEINELLYNGLESPASILVDKLPPGATGWVHSYNQTYKFNSSGDIKGYVVNAVVSYIDQSGNKVILRLASTAFSPVAS